MKKDIVSTQMRIPRQLRDWLKESAKRSNRSMNNQLVNVLTLARAEEIEEKLREKMI